MRPTSTGHPKTSVGFRTAAGRRRCQCGVFALLTVGFLALVQPAQAQDTGRIVGQVTEEASGGPLGEVQVYLPDRGIGALTRQNGSFAILDVPAGTYEIRAERIGLGAVIQQVTVTAGGTATVNFVMEQEALGLDEIVVTGTAGAARRREIGNAIAQINVADIPERPTQTFELLQAAAPGIELTTVSGDIGMGQRIRLRGITSVAQSNQPIIYVDGVRIMDGNFPITQGADQYGSSNRGAAITVSPIDALNPSDIERIEVIKGSAATTLYGTEASGGVIQIFTKRGATGAPVWTAEVQQGTGWARKFGGDFGESYLSMEHYMRDAWWGGGYEGGEFGHACVTDPDSRWGDHNKSAGGACSWPGAVWFQTYALSVRGGGESLQYFASGQYQDDTGLLANDFLEKYAFRGNFTFTPVADLQFQWNTAYTNMSLSNTPSANNAQGIMLNAFRKERNYFGDDDPVVIGTLLDWELLQTNERFTTGSTVTYSPLPSLTNRLTVGYDLSLQEGRNIRPFGFSLFPQGGLTNRTWQKRVLTFDYVGTYGFQLTPSIRSNFSWGGQAIGDEERDLQAWGEEFPGAAEPTVNSGALRLGWEERQKVWNAGFFVQNVLDISDRYFLTVGLRVDGNSAFGEGFGLQPYPKVSGSWVISDEEFWPESWGSMKLRSAYGQSGRAPGAFDKVRTWDPVGYIGESAFVPQNLGNPDLGPEVTGEFEAGFDGAWLDDGLTAAFTYYNQTTTDALFDVSNTPSLGFTGSQARNIGTIRSTGWELQLDASPIRRPDWGWDVGMNFTFMGSEVVDLGGAAEFDAAGGRIIEGEPVPVEVDEYVTNPDDIADPVIESDHVYGPTFPTDIISGHTNLRLPGNVQLSARGEYRGGFYMFVRPHSISRSVRSPQCFEWYVDPHNSIELNANTPALWRARCTPSLRGEGYFYKGDFFKLRSVTATIPVGFAFQDAVDNATLTLSLNNSYLWTREIPWMDPEMGDNDGADALAPGSSERVPAPITFRISLRVTF